MAYGDTTRARSLAGNPSTTNVSAGDVTQAVAYGDSMVDTFTGYSSWTSSDGEYESIQTASEYFASSYVRDRFDDPGGKAKTHYERAMAICDKIRMGSRILIATPDYRTHPLNEDATPYKSMSGANNSVDDSDL